VLRLVRRSVFAGRVEHCGRGRLHAAQPASQSPQSKATLQQLMATALVHLGGYDDAADVIEQILAEDRYPHLAELYKRLYRHGVGLPAAAVADEPGKCAAVADKHRDQDENCP
jgi:hypothetical protein